MAEPQRVGRYVIKQVLGHGGMGTVYLAEDPLLKRRVAIKVVKAAGEARQHAMTRFKREAEISAQLNHPNVVTVYDVGIEPDIGPFLTMEYIEGKNLAQHIKAHSLDMESSVRVLIQAMRALRAAHRMAIVHRDVKPENILLSEEGRGKLMDFGIARSFTHGGLMSDRPSFAPPDFADESLEDAAGTIALRITGSGDFLGSPAYAPPEILKGADGTPSSDRYSFAATAFELLTGQLPHPGTTLGAIIAHILKEGPAIPPDMDPRVAKVFDRAMAPDPDHRHHTLVEFMEELIDALPLAAGAKARLFTTLNQSDDGTDVVGPRRSMPMPVEAAPKPLMTGPARPKKIDLDEPAPAAPRSGGTQRMTVPRKVQEPVPWGKWIQWALLGLGAAYALQWAYPRIAPLLDTRPRALSIRTQPTGAQVFVDGVYLGVTPLDGAQVSHGTRTLSLRKEGYLESLQILPPGDQTLSVVLERAGRGVAVETVPPGAEVRVNGVLVGQTPLAALPSVDPRSDIIVSLEGYRPFTGRLDAGIPRPIVLEKLGGN